MTLFFVLLLLGLPFFFHSKAFFPFWTHHFLVGIIYVLYKNNYLSKSEAVLLTLLCAIEMFYFQSIYEPIVTLTTILLIYNWPEFKSKTGDFLGKISYSLYLTHVITGGALLNFLSHFVNGDLQKFIALTISFSLSILFSYLYYKFIEEPSLNASKKNQM